MPVRHRSLLLLLALVATPLALASPNDIEIDGDPNDSPAGAPHDWDVINAGGSSAMQITGLHVDPFNGTIFTNTLNRDTESISSWTWTDGSLAEKDNLLNGMAASFNGDRFYFAVDRSANNADGQYGVWLLEDDITLDLGGTFNGSHGPQDVLLVITAGAFFVDVQVYQWVGGLDGISPLAPPSGAVQVAINSTDVASPWTHDGVVSCPVPGGFNGCMPQNTFMEGGIDLAALGVSGCYRTVLVETRSSQSPTAALKDFMIMPLSPPCEPVAVEPSTWGAIKKQYR